MSGSPSQPTTKRYHAIAPELADQLETSLADMAAMQKPRKLPASAIRPIIVYALSDAKAVALAGLEQGLPVWVMSAPGIAGTIGPRWLKEILAQAQAAYPKVTVNGVLDCGDNEGHALMALQHNIIHVRYTGSLRTAYKLTALAEKSGAQIHQNFAETLDLRDADDLVHAAMEWLEPQADAVAISA